MKILLDENFPRSAEALLATRGHEVFLVGRECPFGASDEVVFATAQRIGAVLLTSDRDFYHTIPLTHPKHFGIVVVALRQPSRQAILSRLEWFLTHLSPPFDNRTFILRDRTYRARTTIHP